MNLEKQVDSWRADMISTSSSISFAKDDKCEWTKDFETITLPALEMYRKLYGHLLVPQSFCVPATQQWPKSSHAHKLGFAVLNLRRYQGMNSTRDGILDCMEFIWDPIRYQFEKVTMPACVVYVKEKGDLNTIPRGYTIPKKESLYPTACRGYRLGEKIYQWRLNGARPDLLEDIKALGFNPDPIVFSQRDLSTLLIGLEWFHATRGYKERVKKRYCLPRDHPTLPGLALGQLFHRAKKWDEMVGFSDTNGKELKVFATWKSVYQSTILPLLEMYFKVHDNLHIPLVFQVPSRSPWPTWSWKQKLGAQAHKLRKGSMSLTEDEKDVLESMHFKWGPKGCPPQRETFYSEHNYS